MFSRSRSSLEEFIYKEIEKRLSKNQGVGKGAINYQSYHGLLAKGMVPISIENWHKVQASIKDKI